MKAGYVLLAHPEVVDLREQPPAVPYVDQDGRIRHHTFDFLATKRDGTRSAIEVKPAERAERKGWPARLEMIAAQMPQSFADDVLLLTDRELTRVRVHDAVLLHDMRREPNADHDRQATALAQSLVGCITVKSFVGALDLGAYGFAALVRIIGTGTIRKVSHGPLSYDSWVARAANTPANQVLA